MKDGRRTSPEGSSETATPGLNVLDVELEEIMMISALEGDAVHGGGEAGDAVDAWSMVTEALIELEFDWTAL